MKNRIFIFIIAAVFLVVTAGCANSSDTAATVSDSKTITLEKAKEIALSHAGLSGADVTFIKSNLDIDDGRQVYEIEFYFEKKEYDYEIDAATGDIISYDHDVENYKIPGSSSSSEYISEDEAKSIALAKVSGASESDIKQLYLDYDDGTAVYEGKIIFNEIEYEFEINAVTGEIVSWDVDSVYD